MSIFTGAGVALVTPFKEDLSVDYDQLEKFIDFQIDNGTDSIVICGTSGEASTMSHDEQIEVVSACVSSCQWKSSSYRRSRSELHR